MSLKAERGRHKGQSKDRERRIENKKFKKKRHGCCSRLPLAFLARDQAASRPASPGESNSRLEFLCVISCFPLLPQQRLPPKLSLCTSPR